MFKVIFNDYFDIRFWIYGVDKTPDKTIILTLSPTVWGGWELYCKENKCENPNFHGIRNVGGTITINHSFFYIFYEDSNKFSSNGVSLLFFPRYRMFI